MSKAGGILPPGPGPLPAPAQLPPSRSSRSSFLRSSYPPPPPPPRRHLLDRVYNFVFRAAAAEEEEEEEARLEQGRKAAFHEGPKKRRAQGHLRIALQSKLGESETHNNIIR